MWSVKLQLLFHTMDNDTMLVHDQAALLMLIKKASNLHSRAGFSFCAMKTVEKDSISGQYYGSLLNDNQQSIQHSERKSGDFLTALSQHVSYRWQNRWWESLTDGDGRSTVCPFCDHHKMLYIDNVQCLPQGDVYMPIQLVPLQKKNEEPNHTTSSDGLSNFQSRILPAYELCISSTAGKSCTQKPVWRTKSLQCWTFLFYCTCM